MERNHRSSRVSPGTTDKEPSAKSNHGHGNGSGPHNIALQEGLANGALVEYHFHKWMAYNAIFEHVPQPENGFLTVSQGPGLGLNPKSGLIREYKVVERTSVLHTQPGAI